MTENQIKALWMAQHCGQRVLIDVDNSDIEHNYPIEKSNMYRIDESHLLLRTVDMLTDDEAIAIGEIINVSPYKYVDTLGITDVHPIAHVIQFYDKDGDTYGGTVHIYLDGGIIWHYENIGKYDHHCLRLLEAYSYLRSIGILLPFTYLNSDNQPVTLQPADILAKGWAKIKAI